MDLRQRAHIDTVFQATGIAPPQPSLAVSHDAIIQSSWRRCVHQYGLDPSRMQAARILPQTRLREHQQRIDDFARIARHGLETLHGQVAGMGYVVLLTDAQGVTVDYLGDANTAPSLRRAGLYLGAEWSEAGAGTCAVGTALATGQALTVHQADHFDATHIPLTCTAAPLFDSRGTLHAILDISALTSPSAKASQGMALQLVRIYAAHIENANFLRVHHRDWILRLNASPEFVDVDPEYLVALDDGGHIVGHNHRARTLLEAELRAMERNDPVLGQPFETLFDARPEDLGRYVYSRPSEQRRLALNRTGALLYLSVLPPARWSAASAPDNATDASGTSDAPMRLPAPLAALCGGDTALEQQLRRAARLADSPLHLLVQGETGSGKEYFAKALHQASARRDRPFVAVNCAAIPETLIESELFGHLPNSFSGAGPRVKRGLIQEADGGTLFLDEIGDMPHALQSRLLRVLAEGEVLPVGAARPIPVRLAVISATHRQLDTLVAEGGFREDLFYRLNGARFSLPPLRGRADLDWLITLFLGEQAPALSPAARERLHRHRWPGNLRELRNVLEYARAVCGDGCIDVPDLPDGVGVDVGSGFGLGVGVGACDAPVPGVPAAATAATAVISATATTARGALSVSASTAPSPLPSQVAANKSSPLASSAFDPHQLPPEGMLLMQYLRASGWNLSAVARQIGISRMTLYRRMARYGIASPNQRDTHH